MRGAIITGRLSDLLFASGMLVAEGVALDFFHDGQLFMLSSAAFCR